MSSVGARGQGGRISRAPHPLQGSSTTARGGCIVTYTLRTTLAWYAPALCAALHRYGCEKQKSGQRCINGYTVQDSSDSPHGKLRLNGIAPAPVGNLREFCPESGMIIWAFSWFVRSPWLVCGRLHFRVIHPSSPRALNLSKSRTSIPPPQISKPNPLLKTRGGRDHCVFVSYGS